MNFITDYHIQEQVRAHEETIAQIQLIAEARRAVVGTGGATRARFASWVNRAIFRVDPCAEVQRLRRTESAK